MNTPGTTDSVLRRRADLVHTVLAATSIAFLAFVAGAGVMLADVFPARHLSNAYVGARALIEKSEHALDRHKTDFWAPARNDDRGVSRYDPDKAYNGLTLYTSGDGSRAALVSMSGDLLHEWEKPFSEIHDDTAAVKAPQPDALTYWRRARVYPNGDIIAIYVAAGDSPWGYGMVRLDRDSNVLWKYLEQTHHDFDALDDGTVYALTHEVRFNEMKGFEHLKPPRIDDFVVVLSPDGRERKKVSIIDAFRRSPYSRLLSRVAWYTKGDFIHTNAIEYIDAEKAAVLPFATEGQVLLSFRELDTLAVLDLEREVLTWALRGPWLGQHDPDVMPDGRIMLFDNRGHFGDGGRSRILEFDPRSVAITWQHAGTRDEPFDSDVRAVQALLPNGNVLITESTGGRLLEVTRANEVVWEYVNPLRATHPETGAIIIPIVSSAERAAASAFDARFLAKLNRSTRLR